jgi:hypothetical protein
MCDTRSIRMAVRRAPRPLPFRPVILPIVVMGLCALVVLVGGAAELLDTVRTRRAPALVSGAEGVEERPVVADVGRWPFLAWMGLAAFTVLVPVSVFDRRPDVDELPLAVLILGFAGERAFYLLRRRRSGDGQSLGAEVLSLVVAAVGLLMGFTI